MILGLFNPFVILFRLGLNDHDNVWPAFVPMTLGPMRIYDHGAKYFAHISVNSCFGHIIVFGFLTLEQMTAGV